jgi:uncharacterized protein YbjT (DUF2867 family)
MGSGELIVVLGATGRQGGAVARHLLADGWRVRALTRKPTSAGARRLAERGAEVVGADLNDPGSLSSAFGGAHGLYNVQPTTRRAATEVRWGRNVADAALAAGVEHVVHGSAGTGQPGTGIPSWESKLTVEQHMRALGLRLTVLRPMACMELMTDRDFYPWLSTWSTMPRLMGEDRPVPWVCADDLGALAARAFADSDTYAGAALTVATDVESIRGCRRTWQEVTGRPPRGVPVPVGVFEWMAGTGLTTMWRWLETGDVPLETAPTRALVRQWHSVEGWLRERHGAGREVR